MFIYCVNFPFTSFITVRLKEEKKSKLITSIPLESCITHHCIPYGSLTVVPLF